MKFSKIINEWTLQNASDVDQTAYDDKNKMQRVIDNLKTKERVEQTNKMTAWHKGERGFNYKSASPHKLRVNYYICVLKGYDKEAKILKDYMTSQKINIFEMSLYDYIKNIISERKK